MEFHIKKITWDKIVKIRRGPCGEKDGRFCSHCETLVPYGAQMRALSAQIVHVWGYGSDTSIWGFHFCMECST